MSAEETPVTIVNKLNRLAYNLWWSWNPHTQDLFESIDKDQWKEAKKNPVIFIRRLGKEALIEAVFKEEVLTLYRNVTKEFEAYCNPRETWFTRTYPNHNKMSIAYFSAEFGLHESLPIYSGGLGVLAGDHCKAASDLGLPFVAVGLLYRQGYFSQTIDGDGAQKANYADSDFEELPVVPVLDAAGSGVRVQGRRRVCALHTKG